jgi:hypothetical protein
MNNQWEKNDGIRHHTLDVKRNHNKTKRKETTTPSYNISACIIGNSMKVHAYESPLLVMNQRIYYYCMMMLCYQYLPHPTKNCRDKRRCRGSVVEINGSSFFHVSGLLCWADGALAFELTLSFILLLLLLYHFYIPQ